MSGFKVTIAILILSLPLAAFAVPDDQNDLLKARELVWRAWFAGDTKTLTDLLPSETIAISSGNKHWDTQPKIIKSAAGFRAQGGRLLRLEFKDTRIQRFGDSDAVHPLSVRDSDEE